MARSWMGGFLLMAALGLSGCGADELPSAGGATEAIGVSAFEMLRSDRDPGRTGSRRSKKDLTRVALRLSDLQADGIEDNAGNGAPDSDPGDGGWDFEGAVNARSHSEIASPENTYGATALGVWAAVRAGSPRPRLLGTLLDASLGIAKRPQIDSSPDFVALTLLAELFENAEFGRLARGRYEARVSAEGGAQAFSDRVRALRHRSGFDGLIPYDLTWLMLGASALDSAFPSAGFREDEQVYAQAALADLTARDPEFDVGDPNENCYVQGLAWTLVALTASARDPSQVRRVRSLLLARQFRSGAFPFNAKFPGANLQATAHAVQALSLAGRGRRPLLDAADRGARWLLRQQAAEGGFEFSEGRESTLLDAEIALALFLSGTPGGEGQVLPDSELGTIEQQLTWGTVSSPPLTSPLDL